MPIVDEESVSARVHPRFVATTASEDQGLASLTKESDAESTAWDRFIDYHLVEWWRDSSSLEDDDFVPPSRQTIDLAIKLARAWRDRGTPAPLRVLPDGDGGIAFERRDGELFQSLHIHADGLLELDTFRDCRLEHSTQIRLPL